MEQILLELLAQSPYLGLLGYAVHVMGQAIKRDREEDRRERRRILEALFVLCGEERRKMEQEGEK
jgi:hypothetical protein